ncbi:hypothetical protein D3C76_836880 [compost metagenome]
MNDLDLDQHQHRKTHGITQQRREAGEEQPAESESRRHHPVHAPADVLHDAVHFLRAVAHADGKHQERHQHRVRVQLVVQQGQQTELPDHRHQRAQHHQHGAAQAAGVPEQHGGGDQDRDGEKQQDLLQAGNQVADFFRETGDVNVDVGVLISAAQGLQLFRKHRVIQRLAVGGGGQQRHVDDARGLVERHQLPEFIGALHIAPQCVEVGGGAAVVIRDHRAAVEAVFGHGDPAGGRSPQRLHVRPVNAWQQVELVAQGLQGFQVFGVVDIAVTVGDHDAQGIAQAGELFLVLKVVGNVRLLRGDHLFKAGVELDTGGLIAEHQGGQHTHQQHPQAVVEQRAFHH